MYLETPAVDSQARTQLQMMDGYRPRHMCTGYGIHALAMAAKTLG